MMIAGRRRTVEHDRDEVIAQRLGQLLQ